MSAALALAALSGCVFTRSTVDRSARPGPSQGYVASVVRSSQAGLNTYFALGISNADTGEQFVFPFGDPTTARHAIMIELPPGRYQVTYWTTYWGLTRQMGARRKFPARHPGARPFAVVPGEIVVIGGFEAESAASWTHGTHRAEWRIAATSLTVWSAAELVRSEYPGFVNAPLRCVACFDFDEPSDPPPL